LVELEKLKNKLAKEIQPIL